MVIRDLREISPEKLSKTFNLAFEDYQVTLQMNATQLRKSLARNSYEPSSSVGLFDEDRLVGFVFNGKRENRAYDCGTAIIPSYRGKGYAHLLLDQTIQILEQKGLTSWQLEVLSMNTRAKELYKGKGFKINRQLNCYTKKITNQDRPTPLVSLIPGDISLLQKNTDCLPSWQNSKESIEAGALPVWNILSNNQSTGYLCFSPESGSITQLFIFPDFRNRGIAFGAIKSAQFLCKVDTLRYINIDDSYEPLNKLLTKTGFTLFATQEELILHLGNT
ncbi:GNAT family N-acetyltransferase [uncultured Sphaerochaeta sp.]|uniref:GNAT family N-acetyltransferase n=1 Tax=uncultured Sphaerochaeta sp. TaxID=886478 RepID=UPI00374A07DF